MRALTSMVAAAAAIGFVALPLLSTPAQAAPVPVVTTMTLQCQTGQFTPFSWAAEATATAIGDGTKTELTVQFNDLPGKSPAPLDNQDMVGTGDFTIGAAAVQLKGTKKVTAAPLSPLPNPALIGRFSSTATSLNVDLTKVVFAVAGFDTICTGTGAVAVGPVLVEKVDSLPPETPLPTATPTPTVTPTPTPSPTKKADESGKKGVVARGTAKFACKLQTLGSPFDYNPAVTMSGNRAKVGDSKVTLQATFTDIPGLAPLPIDNGTMKITAAATVGGKKVSFAQSSSVSVPAYGKVPVPTLTATISTDEDKLPVEITAFKFDFGVMSGLQVYSECTGGGKLSVMTVGVGAADADDDDSGDTSTAASSSGDTLPKTGAGAPLMVIGLWSSAFVLLAVALFLFLPSRGRQSGA